MNQKTNLEIKKHPLELNVIDDKREKEKEILASMIEVYCRGNKHISRSEKELCPSCRDLLDYSSLRVDKCPFMETKTYCANCHVHCYKQDRRDEIRQVMKYAGPRIVFKHPLMTIDHGWQSFKDKRRKRREAKRHKLGEESV